jgi:hypothetical protein
MARRKGAIARAAAGVFRVSHTVPLVGFMIAAALALCWWHFRGVASTPVRALAVALGLVAIFFAVVAAIGFAMIILERLAVREGRESRRRGR